MSPTTLPLLLRRRLTNVLHRLLPSLEMEDDPFSKEFDLLVCGTGIVESIVASSAALAGKRVLHIDGNEFYGDCDATLPLPQLHSLLSPLKTKESGVIKGLAGSEIVVVGSLPALPEGISQSTARRILLDIRPRLLLAQGDSAGLLVSSDTARYLSLRRVSCCCVIPNNRESALRVPGSKADVFLDSGLSLLEKRSVMRFLQMAMDGVSWGADGEAEVERTDVAEDDSPVGGSVKTLNEKKLGAGRALLRPQNKAVCEDAQAEQNFKTLGSLLTESPAYSLSARVQKLIVSALTMWDGDISQLSTSLGMSRVRSYLAALNRFGGTALLTHEYGMGSVSESFCRLAAVHSALYMLGASLKSINLVEQLGSTSGECAGNEDVQTLAPKADRSTVQSHKKLMRLTLSTSNHEDSSSAPPITVTTSRALLAPKYASLLVSLDNPIGPLASPTLQPVHFLCVCVCVLDISHLGDDWDCSARFCFPCGEVGWTGKGRRTPSSNSKAGASIHCILPSDVSSSRHTPVCILEQGEDDKVTPSGFRVLYFTSTATGDVCSTPGFFEEFGSRLRKEATCGRWFNTSETTQALPNLAWGPCTYVIPSPPASVQPKKSSPVEGVSTANIFVTPLPSQHSSVELERGEGRVDHPRSSCSTLWEESVECAEKAWRELFPGEGKLFSSKVAINTPPIPMREMEVPAENTREGGAEERGSVGLGGPVPVEASKDGYSSGESENGELIGQKADMGDISLALQLLEQEPLDFL